MGPVSMPAENSIGKILSVRSQLDEQALVWLAYVSDYPNHETMPGKAFGLPPYYDAKLGRRPADLYISPIVRKQVPKSKREPWNVESPKTHTTDSPSSNSRGVTGDAQSLSDKESEIQPPDSLCDEFDVISVPWENELRSVRPGLRALIYGAPGQGKSWLAQNTASQLAEKARKQLDFRTHLLKDLVLPVCLRIDDLVQRCGKEVEIDSGNTNDFEEKHVRRAVKHLLRNVAPFDTSPVMPLPHLSEYIATNIHEDRFWIFLDALDEFTPSDENDQLLHQFFTVIKGWRTRVFVTARPYARGRFDRAVASHHSKAPHYELDRLRRGDAEVFVNLWFNRYAPQHNVPLLPRLRQRAYREIAESPQLLT